MKEKMEQEQLENENINKGKKKSVKKSPRQEKSIKKGKNTEPEEPPKPQYTITFDEYLNLYSNIYCPPNLNGCRLRTLCRQDNTDVIQELLDRGCNPEGRDGYGCNCIHVACEYGRINVLKQIIKTYPNIDINGVDQKGWTGCIYASAYNNLEVLQYLVSIGADINKVDNINRNALHWAVMKGSVECLHFLLKQGIDIETKDISIIKYNIK